MVSVPLTEPVLAALGLILSKWALSFDTELLRMLLPTEGIKEPRLDARSALLVREEFVEASASLDGLIVDVELMLSTGPTTG